MFRIRNVHELIIPLFEASNTLKNPNRVLIAGANDHLRCLCIQNIHQIKSIKKELQASYTTRQLNISRRSCKHEIISLYYTEDCCN